MRNRKQNMVFMGKGLWIWLCLCGVLFCTGCDRQDLNELYKMAAENEIMVKHLEETAFDLNQEITNLHNLTLALMKRMHVTDWKSEGDSCIFIFGDDIRVAISQGKTPMMEIDPVNGNWIINGKDTGIQAKGKDGIIPEAPKLRIDAETNCWEYSADGEVWTKTTVKATGQNGTDGQIPEVGINENGNWTIGGLETLPPVQAVGRDGHDMPAPMLGIDKSVTPPVWQISLDNGVTWEQTEVPALAQNGEDGEDGADASPYIENVMVVGDTIIFIFNANIPGTVPPTRIRKVVFEPEKLEIKVTTNEWVNIRGKLWLLFGIKETHTLSYQLEGDVVQVDVAKVLPGLDVSIDKNTQRVTIVSVDQSAHDMAVAGEVVLAATTADGRIATCSIPVSLVYAVPKNNFNESFFYKILTASRQRIAYLYLVYNDLYPYSRANINSYMYAGAFDYSGICPVAQPYETTLEPYLMKDADGNTYRVGLLYDGGSYQVLCALENLKTTRYNDGKSIPYLKDAAAWNADRNGAFCYYLNDELNKDKYGALYNAYAITSGKLAPYGWKIPTDEEWKEIERFVSNEAGLGFPSAIFDATGWRGPEVGKMIKNQGGWNKLPGGASGSGWNRYRFSALPGGMRNVDGSFQAVGAVGCWWSETLDAGNLFYRKLQYDRTDIYRGGDLSNSVGLSVRCIKMLND